MTSVLLIALYQNVKCVSYYNLENPLKHSHSFLRIFFCICWQQIKKNTMKPKNFDFCCCKY